jgi:hypothetical protein
MTAPRRFTLPFALWLLAQAGIIGLCAANPVLVRGQSANSESWATQLALLTQLLLSTVLWTSLLASGAKMMLTLSSTWPMLGLAAVLTGEAAGTTLVNLAAANLWLAGLAALRFSIAGRWHPMLGTGLLLWVFGGLALAYLHAEFALPAAARTFAPSPAASPLLAALALGQSPARLLPWLALAGPLFVAAPFVWRRLRQCRQGDQASP